MTMTMTTRDLLLLLSSTGLVFAAAFLFLSWGGVLWDRLTDWLLADYIRRMRGVGLSTSDVPHYLRCWGASMVAVAAASALLGIPLIGLAVTAFIYVAPRYVLEGVVANRRALLRDQMVGVMTGMANSARAGLALAQALSSASLEAPDPLAAEFRRIVQEVERGRPLPDAIRAAKERLELDGFTLFSATLLTCLDRGGRVTEALDRIGNSLQETQRLERKLEADTAAGRKVVVILTAFPVVFLAGFYMLDPEATGVLFSTILGQIIVVMVLGLAYASGMWARRILTIDL